MRSAPIKEARDRGGKTGGVSADKSKRIAYVLRHRQAKDLAGVLGKHFKDEVEVLAEPTSNFLLISGSPAVIDEVLKLLEQMDRLPRLIAVEILVVETLPVKGADGKPGVAEKELMEKDFSGPIDQVSAKVAALKKSGLLGETKQFQLAALENEATRLLVGGAKPYTVGRMVGPAGKGSNTVSYRDVGTTVTVTPRITPEKQVLLDLRIEDSRMHVPADGVVLGTADDGTPVRATEFINSQLTSKLTVNSGQAVLAEGVKTTAKAGHSQTLIIVAAWVVEPGAKPDK